MPIYEYRCMDCGSEQEFIQKFSDAPKTECPDCGGRLEKIISNTAFVLKGSGWYVTDYASGDRKTKMDAERKALEKPGSSENKPSKETEGKKNKASAT